MLFPDLSSMFLMLHCFSSIKSPNGLIRPNPMKALYSKIKIVLLCMVQGWFCFIVVNNRVIETKQRYAYNELNRGIVWPREASIHGKSTLQTAPS